MTLKQPIPPTPVQSRKKQQADQQAAAQAAFNAKIPQKNTSNVAKQQADQLAAQRAAQAALDARNRAIQQPVNTTPPPNMSNLRSIAPALAATLMGENRSQPPMPPRQLLPQRPMLPPTPPRQLLPQRPMPMPTPPRQLLPQRPMPMPTPPRQLLPQRPMPMPTPMPMPQLPPQLQDVYNAQQQFRQREMAMMQPYQQRVEAALSTNPARLQLLQLSQQLGGQNPNPQQLQRLQELQAQISMDPRLMEAQQQAQMANLEFQQQHARPFQEEFGQQLMQLRQYDQQQNMNPQTPMPLPYKEPETTEFVGRDDPFFQSPEFIAHQNNLGVQTQDMYNSPIFGPMGSGSAGRAQEDAYRKYMAQQQVMQGQAQVQPPGFAQPYMQEMGAAAASRTGGMFQPPKGVAPRSNPMTGLGAFSANPSTAAANPFAGLGVTAGAQQARQNVQPPYNPQMDDFKGSGQMFGAQAQPMMGQPQTQQSPYAQQQGSNLMQNAGQVGQGVYGSFVGQNQQQPAMQQQQTPQQQNPTQTMQGSVAPPMQAGFNFFDQSQAQNNTGGDNTGGGGLF